LNHLTRLDTPLRLPHPVVTVGTFDGMHLGHRAILDALCREAARHRGTAIVLTFDRHPRAVLQPDAAPPILLSREERLREMRAAGIGLLVELPFTLEFSRMPPEVFIRDLLAGVLGARGVVEGRDHRFGRQRSGDVSMLQALGPGLGFDVIRVDPVLIEGAPVSSTRIRGLISSGQVESASDLLGRPYGVPGRVVSGDRRGREIGYPTANVRPDDPAKLLPPDGVYLVGFRLGSETLHGLANLGLRPTFGEGGRGLEVHLLDFTGDLYGQQTEVRFLSRIREERKFDGVPSLVAQIQDDIRSARGIIAPSSTPPGEDGRRLSRTA
jgi:riboflavin kinase/FMN adenylyltransferase